MSQTQQNLLCLLLYWGNMFRFLFNHLQALLRNGSLAMFKMLYRTLLSKDLFLRTA